MLQQIRFIATALVLGIVINVTAQTDEYVGVAKALNYYLDGGTNNDYKTLIKAFHKDAKVKYIDDEGNYGEKSATEFFGGMKPGPKSNRKTRIENIHISGHAANAHIVIEFPTFEFNDYMTLLKVDGTWQIVTKIFYGEKKEFDVN